MQSHKNDHLPSPEVLKRLAISESGFVFDPASGHSFTANETALFILKSLQEHSSLEDLLQDIEKNYQVHQSNLERDVIEFIATLRKYMEG